ncbi:MAG: SIS domain-containing protein [Flavobacteriales bacterium]|jgi:D-sedoheptulose 7-phosphate isomerase
MNTPPIILSHLQEAAELLGRIQKDEAFLAAVDRGASLLSQSLAQGGKAISCGNGGSMCDAIHFAEELSGRYRNHRRGLAAMACSDPAHLTCVGNDYGFDEVFARYLEALGRPGDVLVAISTSGNSPNVVAAARKAHEMGISVLALTGNSGGALAELSHVEVRVPWTGYADRIQEVHIKVIHSWIDAVERAVS